jgi:hypothetical protein
MKATVGREAAQHAEAMEKARELRQKQGSQKLNQGPKKGNGYSVKILEGVKAPHPMNYLVFTEDPTDDMIPDQPKINSSNQSKINLINSSNRDDLLADQDELFAGQADFAKWYVWRPEFVGERQKVSNCQLKGPQKVSVLHLYLDLEENEFADAGDAGR